MTAAAPQTTQGVQAELLTGAMTCAACAAPVQAKLNKVAGVTATVHLSTERARISAPATVSAPHLTGVAEAATQLSWPAPPGLRRGKNQPTRPRCGGCAGG